METHRIEIHLFQVQSTAQKPLLCTYTIDYIMGKNEFRSPTNGSFIVFNPNASYSLSSSSATTRNLLIFDLGENSALCRTSGDHVILVLRPFSTAEAALDKHRVQLIKELRKTEVASLKNKYNQKLQRLRDRIQEDIEASFNTPSTLDDLDDYMIDHLGVHADAAQGGKKIIHFRTERDCAPTQKKRQVAQHALAEFIKAVKADKQYPFITGASVGRLKTDWKAYRDAYLQQNSPEFERKLEEHASVVFSQWESEKDAAGETVIDTANTPNGARKITHKSSGDEILSNTPDPAHLRTLQFWTLGEVLEKIRNLTL